MKAPDSVWIEFMDSFADMAKTRVSDADVWMEDSGSDHLPQYLRATPELLALRDVILGWYRGKVGAAEKMEGALRAYAESEGASE